MQRSTLLSFILTVALRINSVSGQAPEWTGMFQMDDSCDKTKCCCIEDQVHISSLNNTHLMLTINKTGGQCQNLPNGSAKAGVISLSLSDPGAYQITTTFLNAKHRLALNPDGQYITSINLDRSECSGLARRRKSHWEGTFTVDHTCNQTVCCCLAGQLQIKKSNESELRVTGHVAGNGCLTDPPVPNPMEISVPRPQDMNGYQLTTNFPQSKNRFTLTYDNEYVVNINLEQPECSSVARRHSAAQGSAATISSVLILAIATVMVAMVI